MSGIGLQDCLDYPSHLKQKSTFILLCSKVSFMLGCPKGGIRNSIELQVRFHVRAVLRVMAQEWIGDIVGAVFYKDNLRRDSFRSTRVCSGSYSWST